MPQKQPVDAHSIHRSSLFHTRDSTAVRTFEASDVSQTTSDPASVPAQLQRSPVGTSPMVLRLWKSVRDLVFRRDNNLSWELTAPFQIVPGPQRTIIPFNNENIGGDGVRLLVTPNRWIFSPPPEYGGIYRVSSYLEFITGMLAFMTAARLELHKYNLHTGALTLWRVLDKQYLEYGDVNDDGYLEKVVLGGTCLVPIACGEAIVIALYHNNTNLLDIGDMGSVYGYVDVDWKGCRGRRTDLTPQAYNLPDVL
ncbi:MAG TPA: hypothetical protein DIS79_07275 [Bacteroidetes bacterium]|nr:hypothetical protein [Bacteroidota bacterium]HRK05221.1 hypothetical protein [Chlorobiota bacterium]